MNKQTRTPPTFRSRRCDLCADVVAGGLPWRLVAPVFLLPDGWDEVVATLTLDYRICHRCAGRGRSIGVPESALEPLHIAANDQGDRPCP